MYTNYRSDVPLNESVDDYGNLLAEMFPEMPEKFVEANKKFMELLNDYKGPSYLGIPKFLKSKGLKSEGIKLSPDGADVILNEEEKIDILSGKFKIAQKIFIDKKGPLAYYVLASKKNKMTPEGLKDKFKDLVGGTLGFES